MNIKGWQPIEKYFEGNYDWVLVKYYDRENECIPNVAEFNKKDKKWHLGDSNYSILPEIFKVKHFFDMQQLDIEDKLGDIRKEEYEQVKELNNEMKKTSQQTIERSKYYSRIDYYESLGEENI